METQCSISAITARLGRIRREIGELELWLADERDYVANMERALVDIEDSMRSEERVLVDRLRSPCFRRWLQEFALPTDDASIRAIIQKPEVSFADGFVRRSLMAILMHVQLWKMCTTLNPSQWPTNYVTMLMDSAGSIPWPGLREARMFAAVPEVRDSADLVGLLPMLHDSQTAVDSVLWAVFWFVETVTDLQECREVAWTKLADDRLALHEAVLRLRGLRSHETRTEHFLTAKLASTPTPIPVVVARCASRLRRMLTVRRGMASRTGTGACTPSVANPEC
jgi:hypothetical protein